MIATTQERTPHKQAVLIHPAVTMKVVVLRRFGDPDVLRYEEVSTPRPKPRHVLIKVLAAGINRLDHYLRKAQSCRTFHFPISWASTPLAK